MVVTGKIMDVLNVSDKVTQVVIRVKKDEIYFKSEIINGKIKFMIHLRTCHIIYYGLNNIK